MQGNNNNNNNNSTELGDLDIIAQQLDHDVREILLRPEEQKKMRKTTVKVEKERAKAERKDSKENEKAEKKEAKQQRKLEKKEHKKIMKTLKEELAKIDATFDGETKPDVDETEEGKDNTNQEDEEDVNAATKRAQYKVLRIAANARRKLRET